MNWIKQEFLYRYSLESSLKKIINYSDLFVAVYFIYIYKQTASSKHQIHSSSSQVRSFSSKPTFKWIRFADIKYTSSWICHLPSVVLTQTFGRCNSCSTKANTWRRYILDCFPVSHEKLQTLLPPCQWFLKKRPWYEGKWILTTILVEIEKLRDSGERDPSVFRPPCLPLLTSLKRAEDDNGISVCHKKSTWFN